MKREQSLLPSTEDDAHSNKNARDQTLEPSVAQTISPHAADLPTRRSAVISAFIKILKLIKLQGFRALQTGWQWLEQPGTQIKLAWGLTIVFLSAYVVLLSVISLFRYSTFAAQAYDLGNMDQAVKVQ